MNTTREKQCGDKRAYSKRSKAKRMLDGLIASERYSDYGCSLRMAVYKCQHCKSWHVGHIRKSGV